MRAARVAALAGLLVALGGCAATTLETFPETAEIVERGDLMSRGPSLAPSAFQSAVDERVARLIAERLTLPAVLEIAMLNAPRLRAIYLDQQVLSHSLVESLAAAPRGEGAPSVEWAALRLALLPAANRELSYDLAETYADVAPAFVATAAMVKKDWYAAVAAQQVDGMMRQVVETLQAEAELANEQYRSGTASRGEQARRHLALTAAVKQQAVAQRELVRARERLVRVIGLWGPGADLRLPERLPELPAAPSALDGLEDHALRNRMDLVAARREGGARQLGVAVRSEVREAHFMYLAAHGEALYQRDVVMPLAQASLEFAQREYNGMLIGIYDLLKEVREQIEAGKDYVATLRDFWIAEAELMAALGGVLPQSTASKGDVRS